jgi:hypothetical protein
MRFLACFLPEFTKSNRKNDRDDSRSHFVVPQAKESPLSWWWTWFFCREKFSTDMPHNIAKYQHAALWFVKLVIYAGNFWVGASCISAINFEPNLSCSLHDIVGILYWRKGWKHICFEALSLKLLDPNAEPIWTRIALIGRRSQLQVHASSRRYRSMMGLCSRFRRLSSFALRAESWNISLHSSFFERICKDWHLNELDSEDARPSRLDRPPRQTNFGLSNSHLLSRPTRHSMLISTGSCTFCARLTSFLKKQGFTVTFEVICRT